MKNYEIRDIIVIDQNHKETKSDQIVKETPLTLFINDQEFVTLVCTPDHINELVVGFMLSEGFISDITEVDDLAIIEGGFVNIKLKTLSQSSANFLRRNLASCCGRGRAALYFINDAKQVREVNSLAVFHKDVLLEAILHLERKAELFHLTGGAHYASLIQSDILYFFEDIGRHNAVDKVIGRALRDRIDNRDKILALSGRVSSEIIIKAARGQIPVIVSKAAPTDLAVDLADDLNISLIGFARGKNMNIYSHPERIIY